MASSVWVCAVVSVVDGLIVDDISALFAPGSWAIGEPKVEGARKLRLWSRLAADRFGSLSAVAAPSGNESGNGNGKSSEEKLAGSDSSESLDGSAVVAMVTTEKTVIRVARKYIMVYEGPQSDTYGNENPLRLCQTKRDVSRFPSREVFAIRSRSNTSRKEAGRQLLQHQKNFFFPDAVKIHHSERGYPARETSSAQKGKKNCFSSSKF